MSSMVLRRYQAHACWVAGALGHAEPHSFTKVIGGRPNPGSPVHGLGSSNSQEQGPSPPPLGGRGKGAEWLSGVVLCVCNVAVARRLGLHPEEDGEQQHYEEEEDGTTHSQGHDHL